MDMFIKNDISYIRDAIESDYGVNSAREDIQRIKEEILRRLQLAP